MNLSKAKIRIIFFQFLCLVSFNLTKNTQAADWFINKACLAACNGTSWSQGWNELNQVRWGVGGIQPGDTLWISGGSSGQLYTTQLSPDINGLPGQRIYIKPGAAHPTQSSGHDALVTISVSNDHCVTIYRSYITVDGRGNTEADKKIKITGCGKNGVSAGSDGHHIEIFNLSIWNTPAADSGNSATNCAIAFGAESPPAGQLIAEIKGNDIKHPYEYGIWAHGPITISQYGLILIHDNEIYDFPGEDFLWASRGVDVYHNIIRGPKASANKEGFHADGIVAMGSYVRIFNNLIYDLQPGPTVQSGMGSYIYLNPFTTMANTTSCCIRVMNNLIYESRPPQYASQVKHSGINYRVVDGGGTHFSSMDTEPGVGPNWTKYWEIGGTGTESWMPDNWYYGNLYNRGLEASWQTGSEGSWSSISDIIIANNTFADMPWSALGFYPSTVGAGALTDIYIVNNIFHNNGRRDDLIYPISMGVGGGNDGNFTVGNWDNHPNIVFDNNIVSSGSGGHNGVAFKGIGYSYASFKSANSGTLWQPNLHTDGTETNDPGLTSNFQLSAGSNAIDKARDLSFLSNIPTTSDRSGISRPKGSAWDIGAYEYVEGRDTTPPAAPSGLAVN